MNKQKITVALTILTLLTTALFVAPSAFDAGTTANSHPNFFQGLIQFIEQKFGLDKTQVQSAVNQYKGQVKATITPRPTLSPDQIQAQEKTRLDKLVSSGKITSEQETDILNELTILNTQYPLTGLTGAQRQTKMQAMQAAFKTWAQAQTPSINITGIMPFGGMGGPGGPRGGVNGGFRGRFGPRPTVTPTPTP
ncbi:MAG: hypothetical protein ABSE17_04270 [Candidatus Levyibacteriota bacterium]|jgi:hypothetical protein